MPGNPSGGLHSFIEGGWDGTARDPPRDSSLLKDFTHVYQDNSPFVEFKELYLERGVGNIDWRIGIQRFSWGRLDEYPANDLLNPWDYNRFLIRPVEERKIGVPSVSVIINRMDWAYQLVWEPWFVPYRLPDPNARWSVVPTGSALANTRMRRSSHRNRICRQEASATARSVSVCSTRIESTGQSHSFTATIPARSLKPQHLQSPNRARNSLSIRDLNRPFIK